MKLAFCRFQPHAIEGKHLSRAAQTQYIQVAPDRAASATREDSRARIHLSGPARDNDAAGGQVDELDLNDLEVEPPSMAPDAYVATPQYVPERAAHHLVLARLEYRSGSSDLSWTSLNEGVELSPYETMGSPGDITWKGELPLNEVEGDLDRYRIAVEEWELYPVDAGTRVPDAPEVTPPPEVAQPAYELGSFEGVVADQLAQPSDGNTLVPGGRLAYVAHLAVPTGGNIEQLQSE